MVIRVYGVPNAINGFTRIEWVKSVQATRGLLVKKLYPRPKAVRMKCLDCSAGSATEVALCPVLDCTLYLYRFGRKPTKDEKELWQQGKALVEYRGQTYNEQDIQSRRSTV